MSEPLSILTHYLRLACQEAGTNWNGENETELGMIADEIRKVVRAEMADEISDLRTEIRDLRNRVTFAEQAASGIEP